MGKCGAQCNDWRWMADGLAVLNSSMDITVQLLYRLCGLPAVR
jgi:hypothetical protein